MTKSRIALLVGLTAALAGVVATLVVRFRTPEEQVALVNARSASTPKEAKAVARGTDAESATPAQTAASHGQDLVMCRSLIQTWVDSLEKGNSVAAERTQKALLAYGRTAKEALDWAIKNLGVKGVALETLRSVHEQIPD